MNCPEFRRKILIDPYTEDEDVLAHARTCPECTQERINSLQFEDSLRQALKIDVPGRPAIPGLKTENTRNTRCFGLPCSRWVSLAAGMVLVGFLVAGLGLGPVHRQVHASSLSEVVLTHVTTELDQLPLGQATSLDRLVDLFSGFGAVVTGQLTNLVYAGPCWIRAQTGLHLVLEGSQGPVNVLLMPGEFVSHRQTLSSGRFSGLIVPTGYGSMAVVGEKNEQLENALQRMNEAVIWGA